MSSFLGGAGVGSYQPRTLSERKAGPWEADQPGFDIKGNEMQFVELRLGPGDACIAEAGVMMFKDAPLAMETIFGDGANRDEGLLGKLWRGTKRALWLGRRAFRSISPFSAKS